MVGMACLVNAHCRGLVCLALLQSCSDHVCFPPGPNTEAAIGNDRRRRQRLLRPCRADVQEHGGSAREAGQRGGLRAPDGHRRVQAVPGALRGSWHGHRGSEGLRHCHPPEPSSSGQVPRTRALSTTAAPSPTSSKRRQTVRTCLELSTEIPQELYRNPFDFIERKKTQEQ